MFSRGSCSKISQLLEKPPISQLPATTERESGVKRPLNLNLNPNSEPACSRRLSMFKTAEQTAERLSLPTRFANDNLQEKDRPLPEEFNSSKYEAAKAEMLKLDAESQRPLRLKGPSKLMVQFAGQQPMGKVIKCEKPDQIQMLLKREKSLRTAEDEAMELKLQEAILAAEEALKVSLESERRFMFSESLKGDIFEDQLASQMCAETTNGKNGDSFPEDEEDEHVDDDELQETISCILKKHRHQNSQACVPNDGLSFTF